MKRSTVVPLVFALFSLCGAALAADIPDRPPGVTAENWVPISARVGLVLVQSASAPGGQPAQALLLRPPVSGYFMVKGADGWTRLLLVEPAKGPGDVG